MKNIILTGTVLALFGCTGQPQLKTESYVDISRFMGDWYVIANIPTLIERGAHNAVENYRMNTDGTIDTTFTFYQGGFDGDKKIYRPKGFILDKESNAVWGMQFIWPVKADYRIVYVSDDYTSTIIGRNKRDYIWFMARSPEISEHEYRKMIKTAAAAGYDTAKIKPVPQQW